MKWSFVEEFDNVVEKFETIYQDDVKFTEQIAKGAFCEEGQRYSSELKKCEPCPVGTYQDNPEHRSTSCKDHPDVPTSKCPNGHYNDLSQEDIQEHKDKIADRAINAEDLCKQHANFVPNQCNTNRYINPQIVNIQNKTKDKPLKEDDYCLTQPTAASITCPNSAYVDPAKYAEVVNAKLEKVVAKDVCTYVKLHNISTSVSESNFDKASNTRQFRTIKFVGKVDWDGKVSIIRTHANNTHVAGSPHTNVAVKKNVDFSVTRVEPDVGDHYYKIYFADAKGRGFDLKRGVKVHLYNFQFQLKNRGHQYVRKGSDRYKRPDFKGQNYHKVTNNENTFDKNQSKKDQLVTYTAGNSRGSGTLSATSKATVYNTSFSVANYAKQTVKVGANHHVLTSKDFHRDNMEHYKSAGYPGTNSGGTDTTYNIDHYFRDTRDHGYTSSVRTTVRKYTFSRASFKNISIKDGQAHGWGHMVSSWGTNSHISHAEENWHGTRDVHAWQDGLSQSAGNWNIRFHTYNSVTNGEGAWTSATMYVAAASRYFTLRLRSGLRYNYAFTWRKTHYHSARDADGRVINWSYWYDATAYRSFQFGLHAMNGQIQLSWNSMSPQHYLAYGQIGNGTGVRWNQSRGYYNIPGGHGSSSTSDWLSIYTWAGDD